VVSIMKCARCKVPHPTTFRKDLAGWHPMCGLCADEYDRELTLWRRLGLIVGLVILLGVVWLA